MHPPTHVLAIAHLEGAARGIAFRLKELAVARNDLWLYRERALSQWFAYSKTEAGQLSGCSGEGCYACLPRECGRYDMIQQFRIAMYALDGAERSIQRANLIARFAMQLVQDRSNETTIEMLNNFDTDARGWRAAGWAQSKLSPIGQLPF